MLKNLSILIIMQFKKNQNWAQKRKLNKNSIKLTSCVKHLNKFLFTLKISIKCQFATKHQWISKSASCDSVFCQFVPFALIIFLLTVFVHLCLRNHYNCHCTTVHFVFSLHCIALGTNEVKIEKKVESILEEWAITDNCVQEKRMKNLTKTK